MKPSRHIIFSFALSAVLFYFTRSFFAAVLCFIAGIAVDADHIIEYIIQYGVKGFTFRKVYEASKYTLFDKLHIVFHTAEIAIIFWIIAILTNNIYILSISLGFSFHLMLDYIGNNAYIFTYFMTWRILKDFNVKKLVKRRTRHGHF